MSTKIRPQDNFYDYVNKDWIDKAELPSGYAAWGSFEMLHKKSVDDINDLIDKLIKDKNNLNEDQRKIVTVYENYLNFKMRDEQGITPILPLIEEIDKLESKENFTEFLINFYKKYGFGFFHSKSIDADFEDSNLRALMIGSMGLGMGDRDFYDPSHVRHEEIKSAYKVYIEDIIKASKLKFNTDNLFEMNYDLEYRISQSMLKKEEFRNIDNINNVVTIDELTSYCDFIDWNKYLTSTGHAKAKKIILLEPKFMKALNKELKEIGLENLKDILKLDIITSYAGILTTELHKINFNFAKVFSGVKEMRPEKERALSFTEGLVGELIGQEYVKLHFSKEAKENVLKIVDDLIKVYSKRINQLEWMSDTTKAKAIEKLNTFETKIGYPDKFEDYSGIEVRSYEDGGSLFENRSNIAKHFREKNLREINLPVDKTKWHMSPQTVNAYYNPQANEICFPAAILQSPFYDINEPLAKNLGGIGAVIGHEVSHGFDDEGSRFDKDGNLSNWWTEEDYKQYNSRTEKLVDQYSAYEVDGSKVNGKLTLGENIGDLGGVSAALDICLEQAPDDLKLFFENYAYVWRRKSTAEMLNTRLLTDPHSPEEFRCNGVLVNVDKFHEVYETSEGDKMYKPKNERIKIW
ncbi:endopeptidase O [Spiroplasma chinense]|uniref:Endopeptidase O n=1 Tax=Spiroplasma chinense TaxID=216932 RepID=A0A5B9Y690_9MOLU|nr:M13 family metallopeptidase [Spiroplasma chinense]QEH62246.1 endopeptidase O [Spiroplasma chinense]